jgi:hypothetical protein
MDLGDTIDVSQSTSLDSRVDQNLPPPTRQIHKVYTQKSRHENVRQLPVQDQHQLLVFVDNSPTTQTPGNLELPSGTPLISIFLLLCAKGFDQLCCNKRNVPQHLTLSLTIFHLRRYHMRINYLQPLYTLIMFHVIGEMQCWIQSGRMQCLRR